MSDLKRMIVIGVALGAALLSSCEQSSIVGALTTSGSGGSSTGVGGAQGGSFSTPIGTGGGLIGPTATVASGSTGGAGGAGGSSGGGGTAGSGATGGAGGH